MGQENNSYDAIIIGGGIAGLSGAIYLARALRSACIIDNGKSMARWEPDVQNFLGFPEGIAGPELLDRGRRQARRYGVTIETEEVLDARANEDQFFVHGRKLELRSRMLLLTTGIFHIPPDIPGVRECLGHSMFFCKDCDGYRVQDRKIGVYGANNEAVRYALGMFPFSSVVIILTNGHSIHWDEQHAGWIQEYEIPVFTQEIIRLDHADGQIHSATLRDKTCLNVDVLFTTRGDIYYNDLAKGLGAKVTPQGEIEVNADQRTSVAGLYAAGCVTPANCQMIIAAGQGATAAQAINRALLDEDLAGHRLRRLRNRQLRTEQTVPEISVDAR